MHLFLTNRALNTHTRIAQSRVKAGLSPGAETPRDDTWKGSMFLAGGRDQSPEHAPLTLFRAFYFKLVLPVPT